MTLYLPITIREAYLNKFTCLYPFIIVEFDNSGARQMSTKAIQKRLDPFNPFNHLMLECRGVGIASSLEGLLCNQTKCLDIWEDQKPHCIVWFSSWLERNTSRLRDNKYPSHSSSVSLGEILPKKIFAAAIEIEIEDIFPIENI